jgi:putative oxidoreductase
MTKALSFLSSVAISLPVSGSWYALPLHLVVGFGFVQHGYAKLSRGPDAFISILHAIGMPFPDLFGWATIWVEIIGGLLVLFGAFVPVAAVPMVVVLPVATFTVHLPNGFSSIKLMSFDSSGAHFGQPGYETDLLYIARPVTPTAHWLEYLDLAGAILADPYRPVDGTVIAKGPGLGIEWDESAIARFAVERR